MNENENCCKNCKYFVLYYINHKGLYKPLDFGHCVCDRVLINKKKRIYCNEVCKFWESDQEKKQAKHASIEHALCSMADDINHYIQTLSEKDGV